MINFRVWLIKLIAGEYSVIMNVDLNSKRALVRKEKHIVTLNYIDGAGGYMVTDDESNLPKQG